METPNTNIRGWWMAHETARYCRALSNGNAIMNWLALDIGGANLKLADGHEHAASHEFALWNDHAQLALKLRRVIAESPASDHLAVTMTGELADCFANRTEGVRYILQALEEAADARHTRVYLHDGRLVSLAVARSNPDLAASSNWHALARFCGRFASRGSALVIDVGSTTVDIVPLYEGRPVGTASTDLERLLAGELVYTGVERSPVCALVGSLPYRDQRCGVAQELFATTRDVHLLLSNLPEDPDDHHTADHRGATVAAAHRRLARMLCTDRSQVPLSEVRSWAREIAQAQLDLLVRSASMVLRRLESPPGSVVIAGHGEFLARRLLDQLQWTGHIVSLTSQLGPHVSRCATAHGLAVLARELTP